MKSKRQILVTGRHEGWVSPEDSEYQFFEVLEFNALPVSEEIFSQMTNKPFDWIIFTSQRAVSFWTEALLSQGMDLPIETRVACIGEKTCKVAQMDGYTPDFYPSESGTEQFLLEFKTFLAEKKTRVLLPGSSIARPLLKEELNLLGCDVTCVATYETKAKQDLSNIIDSKTLANASLFLFTSPSSVDAVCSQLRLPTSLKVAALGSFTKESLLRKGFNNIEVMKGDTE